MNDLKNNCIVFVCVGNTCRSPMAEALLKSELKRLHIDGVDVSSAGLKGGGKPMNMYTAKTLFNRGLELNNFSSKLINETTFSALAVIAMTQDICEELKRIRQFGLDAGKLKEKKDNIFSFKEIVGYDIPDPYGLGEREYIRAFSQIQGGMSAIIARFLTEEIEKIPQTTVSQPAEISKETELAKPAKTTEITVEKPAATTEKPKSPRKKRTTTATKTTTKTAKSTTKKPAAKKAATKKTTAKSTKTAAKKSAGTANSKNSAKAATPKKTPAKKATTTKKTVKTPKEKQ